MKSNVIYSTKYSELIIIIIIIKKNIRNKTKKNSICYNQRINQININIWEKFRNFTFSVYLHINNAIFIY